jgi:hypothetical protein
MIDPESGQLAGPWCPNRKVEWFIPGTAPTDTCSMHQGPQLPSIAESIGDFLQGLARGLRKVIKY